MFIFLYIHKYEYVYMNKRSYFINYRIYEYSSINSCIDILRNICETILI